MPFKRLRRDNLAKENHREVNITSGQAGHPFAPTIRRRNAIHRTTLRVELKRSPGDRAPPSSGTRPKSRPLISTFPSSVNWRRRSFLSAMLSNRVAGGSRPRRAVMGGPLGQEALKHPPRDPDNAAILADLDPERRSWFHRRSRRSWDPVRRRPNPRRRLILPHVEDASGSFHLASFNLSVQMGNMCQNCLSKFHQHSVNAWRERSLFVHRESSHGCGGMSSGSTYCATPCSHYVWSRAASRRLEEAPRGRQVPAHPDDSQPRSRRVGD